MDLMELFKASLAQGIADARSDAQLAMARQRDGAAFDMRALGAAIGGSLVASDDTSEMSRINAAVRVPTTLDQPAAIVTK